MPQRTQEIFGNLLMMRRLTLAHLHEVMRAHHFGLTAAEIEVLFGIQALEPVSFKDLGAHLTLKPGAVTQTVDNLARAGLVLRTVSETDRRTWYLQLTDAGKIKLAEFQPYLADRKRLLDYALADAEIDEFLRLQRKVIAHLRQAI